MSELILERGVSPKQRAVRDAFAEAAHYCKTNRLPGERIQDCIRRVFHQFYHG